MEKTTRLQVALTYDTGTIPDTLNADIATASALGVVSAGNGLSVTAGGELSVDGSKDIGADLGYTAATDKGTVTIQLDDATIPLADDTNAGLFSAAEKPKLDGIEDGAEVNTVKSITGNGITATDSSGAVTVAADLDTAKGLEISSTKVAVKLGTGLGFDGDGKIENTVTGGLSTKELLMSQARQSLPQVKMTCIPSARMEHLVPIGPL